MDERSGPWLIAPQNKLFYYHLKIHELHALTWTQQVQLTEVSSHKHTFCRAHTHTQEEKYTQMVAQETICFCWLSPRPLIKHGVAETLFPVELVSKQSCVLNNTDMNISISPPSHQLCAPGIGSCWVLPHTLQGWRHVHFLINWILKWPCSDIDLHLMKAAQWHTWKRHTHINPALHILHQLKVSGVPRLKQPVRVLCCVEDLSELDDGWSLAVVLSRAIKKSVGESASKRKRERQR